MKTENQIAIEQTQSPAIEAAQVIQQASAQPAQPKEDQPGTTEKLIKKTTRFVSEKQAKQESKEVAIGVAMVEAGDALGTYMCTQEWDRSSVMAVVQLAMEDALKAGLTVDMLKAKQPCYNAFVDTMNAVREANNFNPISNATRDNYLSRIRKYVASRGAQPLDLFGNIAAKKAATEKKLTSTSEKGAKGKKVAASTQPQQGTKSAAGKQIEIEQDTALAIKVEPGVPSLGRFIGAWLEVNGETNVSRAAADILRMINVQMGFKK